MDTHGRTWTNTFSHARLGMTKTPRRQLSPGVFGGPCQGCQIVYVGPCGARKGYFLKGFTTRKPTSAAVKPMRLAMSLFEKDLKSAQRLGEP